MAPPVWTDQRVWPVATSSPVSCPWWVPTTTTAPSTPAPARIGLARSCRHSTGGCPPCASKVASSRAGRRPLQSKDQEEQQKDADPTGAPGPPADRYLGHRAEDRGTP